MTKTAKRSKYYEVEKIIRQKNENGQVRIILILSNCFLGILSCKVYRIFRVDLIKCC